MGIAELTEIIVEIRDNLVPAMAANLGEGLECEVCGRTEYQVEELQTGCRIETYYTDCSRGCDGNLEFERSTVSTGGQISIQKEQFSDFRCSECDSPNEGVLKQAVLDNEPAFTEHYDLPVKQILSTQVHLHHVSYEPEEKIQVCHSCHSKIHQTDGFREDLEPDMSRKEWEKGK